MGIWFLVLQVLISMKMNTDKTQQLSQRQATVQRGMVQDSVLHRIQVLIILWLVRPLDRFR
ncbi:hypothetical protein A167_00436 [Alcanivorax sp. S71-1-4]|nr:hypothetical protein A167_00436 [Alcanivorax sp. S71-1-4]